MRFEAYDATGAAIDLPTPLSKTTPYTLGIATDATHDFTLTDASGTAVVPTAQSKGRLVMSKADTLTLPDLRGRTPIGPGQGKGLSARALGGQGGDEEVQAHTHRVLSETTGTYGSVNDLVDQSGNMLLKMCEKSSRLLVSRGWSLMCHGRTCRSLTTDA